MHLGLFLTRFWAPSNGGIIPTIVRPGQWSREIIGPGPACVLCLVEVQTKPMDTLTSGEVSFEDDREAQDVESAEAQEHSTTPGGGRQVKWEVVTKTAGLAPAEIIAQRLQSEGIPARAWQEGAGQAFGLTVGLLGNGYVVVPESYLDEAKAILEEAAEWDDLPNVDEE